MRRTRAPVPPARWLTVVMTFIIMLITAIFHARGRHPPDRYERPVSPAAGAETQVVREVVPFGCRVWEHAPPGCDGLPVECVVMIGLDALPRHTRWRVMDGETVQLEAETFADVYFRCDGPGCLDIRLIVVDEASGRILRERGQHVCLE